MHHLELKRKYDITSNKSLINFINSLISLRKITRRKDSSTQIENTKKLKGPGNPTPLKKLTKTMNNESLMKIPLPRNIIDDLQKIEIELMLFDYSNTTSTEEESMSISKQESSDNIINNVNKDYAGIEIKYVNKIKEYDHLGLAEFFISNLLDISLPKLKELRSKFNLIKNNNIISPGSTLKKLKFEIDVLRLYKFLFEHNHADYLDNLYQKVEIPSNQIDTIVDKNPDIKKCRLEYFIQGANTTSHTLEIFHKHAYRIIVFIDKPGLLLRISEILLERPKKIPNCRMSNAIWIPLFGP